MRGLSRILAWSSGNPIAHAKERFPNFLILRERYWNDLDARERARAIDVGRPLMDEYGDARARLRLAKVMRRHQHVATGSRLGFTGHIENDRPGLFARNKEGGQFVAFARGGPGEASRDDGRTPSRSGRRAR